LPLPEADTPHKLADLAAWAQEFLPRLGSRLRVAAIITAEGSLDQPGIAVFQDRQNAFGNAYGAQEASFLVRPDGYIGWRGRSWRNPGLLAYLDRIF
jgi:hypothetical protein